MTLGVVASSYKVPSGGTITAPTDLPNLALWWDASNAGSFSFSSGAVVSQWRDLAGSARHLTPWGTAPSRVGTLNGKNIVTFTGNSMRVAAANMATGINATLFAVLALTDGGPGRALSFGPTGAADDWNTTGGCAIDIEGGLFPSGYRAASQMSSAGAYTQGTWVSFNYTFNGATNVLRSNGTGYTAATDTNTFDIDEFAVGSRYMNTADTAAQVLVAEVFIYSDAKTLADRQAVEAYLKTKWNVP